MFIWFDARLFRCALSAEKAASHVVQNCCAMRFGTPPAKCVTAARDLHGSAFYSLQMSPDATPPGHTPKGSQCASFSTQMFYHLEADSAMWFRIRCHTAASGPKLFDTWGRSSHRACASALVRPCFGNNLTVFRSHFVRRPCLGTMSTLRRQCFDVDSAFHLRFFGMVMLRIRLGFDICLDFAFMLVRI